MERKKAVFKQQYRLMSKCCGHCCDVGTYETKLYTAFYYFCPRGCVQPLTELIWNKEVTCWMH